MTIAPTFASPIPRPALPAQGQTLCVLGIESSCDETAAAVLMRAPDGTLTLRSSIIASQDDVHRPFGGVVPEIAARAHMNKIEAIIEAALSQAECEPSDLHGIAATAGPGLIGGVITGLLAAKGMAAALEIPLMAVNHLEGHALSPNLAAPLAFPYLLLLVSGGHTQLLSVNGLGDYTRLGSTIDDAAGEAFDKTAKVLGLGFPGGPAVERRAKTGDPARFALPRPLTGQAHADFSFAGLKTATLRAFQALDTPSEQDKADISASFQRAVTDCLADRVETAMGLFTALHPSTAQPAFVVAGGVAANTEIRTRLTELAQSQGFVFQAPPLKFCTDNAAMIALAGAERLAAGDTDSLDAKARPRWPLDADAALRNPASGSGKKGPKS